MKAVICTSYGPPEVLQVQEIPKPVPAGDEVLVRIVSSAVNSGDVRVRGLAVKGVMKLFMRLVVGFSRPKRPVLGTVYAGVVESVGEKVAKFAAGDKVFGLTAFRFGTYAEYITVRENSMITSMPRNASFDEAAALLFGAQTAICFLDRCKIEQLSAPKVLVIGSTGAVGTAAVQIAQYYGADVTAVCSSAGENLMRDLGISQIVLYDKEDFTRLTNTFDIVLDAVGKTTAKQCKHLLAKGGIYKTVGGWEYAAESLSQLTLMKELFEQGKLKAVIDKTFPIDAVVDAHRYVDTGRKKGNVILSISKP